MDIWSAHTITGQNLLASNVDVWLKHIEARELLKAGQYVQVGQLFGKSVSDGTLIQGHKYVMDGAFDDQAIQDAITIANNTTDVALIAQNTGIPQNIIQEVKEHFFINEHFIQTNQGFKIGRFERTEEDIALWQAAINGFQNNVSWGTGIEAITISGAQAQGIFERLIKHEYVEKKLMELGISFRGLNQYDSFTPSNFGAHDLAPRMTTGNIVPIEFIFSNGNNVNLNNLESIVQQLTTILKL